MKSTNVHVLFWVRKASTKNIIHPFQKAQSQKGDKKGKKNISYQSFFHEGTICRRRVSVSEYFHNTKMVPTYMYLYHFMQNTL